MTPKNRNSAVRAEPRRRPLLGNGSVNTFQWQYLRRLTMSPFIKMIQLFLKMTAALLNIDTPAGGKPY
jgi:hypothetical protein